jgi:hypothetical protein
VVKSVSVFGLKHAKRGRFAYFALILSAHPQTADRWLFFNRRRLIAPYIATAAGGATGISVPAATKRGSIHEKHKQSPIGVFAAPGISFGVRIDLAGPSFAQKYQQTILVR